MLKAELIDGNTWMVSEVDAKDQTVLSKRKVAVKAGGTADDAIAAITEAQQGPSNDQLAAQAQIDRVFAVKAECRARIYAIADQITQMNIIASASAGRLSADQMVIWQSALQWVEDMQATCLPLINGEEVEWPEVPDGVADLAAAF